MIAEQTEKDIDETRSLYIPVATNTQILFFCVADLANIDPMYQYSLEWFISIFEGGIANAERSGRISQRGSAAVAARDNSCPHSSPTVTAVPNYLWDQNCCHHNKHQTKDQALSHLNQNREINENISPPCRGYFYVSSSNLLGNRE